MYSEIFALFLFSDAILFTTLPADDQALIDRWKTEYNHSTNAVLIYISFKM